MHFVQLTAEVCADYSLLINELPHSFLVLITHHGSSVGVIMLVSVFGKRIILKCPSLEWSRGHAVLIPPLNWLYSRVVTMNSMEYHTLSSEVYQAA